MQTPIVGHQSTTKGSYLAEIKSSLRLKETDVCNTRERMRLQIDTMSCHSSYTANFKFDDLPYKQRNTYAGGSAEYGDTESSMPYLRNMTLSNITVIQIVQK